MHLSKRLETIASMIPSDYEVIDIGCDHALLDIYLTQKGNNHCIASDMRSSVIEIAKKNIQSYQLDHQIEIIQSDGLNNIVPSKKAIAVLAGMGTSTILSILNTSKVYLFSYLIIQTNNEWEKLRKTFSQKGFCLVEEKTVLENHKYYIIMKWQKGNAHYSNKKCFLGPCLMHHSENIPYFQETLQQYLNILQNIPKQYVKKKYDIRKRIHWLKKELKAYHL